jgi:hypothetical protein
VSTAPKPDDKQKMDVDKSWRGAMGTDYNLVSGIYHTEYGFDGNLYPDIIGFPLAGVLGDVSYSGTAGASTPSTAGGAAGTNTITVTTIGTIAAGNVLAVDTGANQEWRTVSSIAGSVVTVNRNFNITHATGATVVQQTGPFTSVFSLLNSGQGQPPSYTVTDWYGANGRQYPGSQFSDLSFKIPNDGILTYQAKLSAFPSVSLAGVRPTPSYSGLKPLTGWQGVTTFGAPLTTADNITLLDASLDIKRKVDVVDTVSGTQAPEYIWSADLSVSGKMTVIMESDAQLLAYLNNSQPSLDINYAPSTGLGLTFHMSKCGYTAATIERGKDFIEAGINFTGIFNTSDVGASGAYSPIKVTLQNSVNPGTYK